MGEINMYKILLGQPEGKRPLRRQACRWEQACTYLRNRVTMAPEIFIIASRIFCILFLWIFAYYIIWGLNKGPVYGTSSTQT
jgi:hypothetical protein